MALSRKEMREMDGSSDEEKKDKMNLGRVGTIGRFRPLHNGSALMLDNICENAEHVIIGIGSSNKYNMRNPFTPEEAKDMIELYLNGRHANYEVILVPDFGHLPEYRDGSGWKEFMVEHYGTLDHFITGNEYVAKLLGQDYDVVHPASLVERENQVYMRGSMVRMAMATGGDYRVMVPACVADYLEEKGMVDRFRREFGLETIAGLGTEDWRLPEDMEKEREHTKES